MRYLQTLTAEGKVKIDLKDTRLLAHLCANARTPSTQLAKKIGLSRDSISYRLEQLEKQGVIQGYRAVIDITKLGFINYHLFFKMSNPSLEKEKKALAKIARYPFVRALIKYSSSYDWEIALLARDFLDFDEKISILLKGCKDIVQDYEILLTVKTYFTSALPLEFVDRQSFEETKSKISYVPDKKDYILLENISEQAKMPLYELGGKLSLSADAASYRMKNLKDSGIIKGFIPVINYTSLGYSMHTILVNIQDLDEKKEIQIKQFFSKNPHVIWAAKTIGKYNLECYILTKNIEHLQQTIISLRSLFPKQIGHYDTLIAYEEYKYTYLPKSLLK